MTMKSRLGAILLLIAMLASITLAQSVLMLASVNPMTVTARQATTLTVSGAGFTEETVLSIAGIEGIIVSYGNESTLTVALPANVVAGTYSVTAINPDGANTILMNAFTVVDPLPTETPLPTATPMPTETPLPTATPTLVPLMISRSEPQQVNNGQANTLSVMGTGFTSGSTVRLIGFGLLETTILHSNAATAIVPAGLPSGTYSVEMTDSYGRVVQSPNRLSVGLPAQPTNTPPPPATPITIAQLPQVSITNFVASPNTVIAGGTTRLTFTVQNRGNQIARTIAVTLGTGSQFVVAGGQSSIVIPDLLPGTIYNATMDVTAIQAVTAGPVTIPLKVTYKNLAGETLVGDAELSVTVAPSVNQSQLVIDGYTVDPILVEPGKSVVVRLTLTNRGDVTASQVALQVTGGDSLLLPNGQGDTFVVGDIQSGARLPLQMPLTVNSSAKNGAQIQPITIKFSQNGEVKEVVTSISVNVATVDKLLPFLMLTSYGTGYDVLKPGMRFTLDVDLQNVGRETARALTVTFGTVQRSGDDGGSDTGNPDSGGSQSNTTPSTTFAPLGTAGLSYVGDIAMGGAATVSQEFIVAGDVTSGIYSLPVTLQYLLPDSSTKQETLNLSLVVISPPRVRINPPNPLPDMMNAGEPVSIALEIINLGKNRIDLTEATVTAVNGEVLEGATVQLEPLATEEDTSLMAVVLPLEAGTLEVNVLLGYIDDLGQTDTIDLTYTAEVMPMPEIIEEPSIPEEPQSEPEPEGDWFGRLVMALVGLGS